MATTHKIGFLDFGYDKKVVLSSLDQCPPGGRADLWEDATHSTMWERYEEAHPCTPRPGQL